MGIEFVELVFLEVDFILENYIQEKVIEEIKEVLFEYDLDKNQCDEKLDKIKDFLIESIIEFFEEEVVRIMVEFESLLFGNIFKNVIKKLMC